MYCRIKELSRSVSTFGPFTIPSAIAAIKSPALTKKNISPKNHAHKPNMCLDVSVPGAHGTLLESKIVKSLPIAPPKINTITNNNPKTANDCH
jgi:hypothetical protein